MNNEQWRMENGEWGMENGSPVRDWISVETGCNPSSSVPLGTQCIILDGATGYNKA